MNEENTILDFHCTCCTLNCQLHVEAKGLEIVCIQGHSCHMGEEFAGKELLLQD
ncbi:MAG: hypothetical protein IJE26_07585 [Oscillospiraceae bacterium]|nr:hypothetical protein [Oscillospiraceae bacterium]